MYLQRSRGPHDFRSIALVVVKMGFMPGAFASDVAWEVVIRSSDALKRRSPLGVGLGGFC